MSDLIIIDITDREKIVLGGSNELKSLNGSGKLLIKNPSQRSRLWNLECDLKEVINTNSERELDVGILNPEKEFTHAYEIQNLKEPCLIVEETLDTARDNSEVVNNTFLYQDKNHCKLLITLTNPLKVPILEIKLRRDLPSFFQDIEVRNPNNGQVELTEENGKRKLLWNIEALNAGEIAKLEVILISVIDERKDQELGDLNVTYLVNNHKLTMMNPEIRGLTDSLSGITTDEGIKPGTWDCNVEFINESEFQVKLEDVKVSHTIATGSELVVSEKPNKVLNPDASWDFDFEIESTGVPQLESKFEFTPLFVVISRIKGEIDKKSTVYHVLSVDAQKQVQPDTVDAYANTDLNIITTIPNLGTSKIQELIYRDVIPKDFVVPLIEQIKITLENSHGKVELHEREEFIEKISIHPDDQSPDNKHEITIELKNLGDYYTPNSKLYIHYPLRAKNPKPETKYPTPIEVKVNTPIKGNYLVIKDLGDPEIFIRYVKRKLKTLKSIKPGVSEGEFDITVRIENKGNVELENIVVEDRIPPGFSLTNFTPVELKYEALKEGDETLIEIKIDELQGNESLTIRYSCSGEGDYPRTEPKVVVKGREELENMDSASTSESSSMKPSVSELSQAKQSILHDVFIEIHKKIDRGITYHDLGELLEGIRDDLPPGPVLHSFMRFSRELKAKEDKIIVGSARDEILSKIKEYQQQYT